MELIIVGFFIILGLIVGSFLNVVILRHNTGRSLGGHSGCMSCASGLAWYELLPIVSFIFLRGKCRSCGSSLSWQYPMVEGALAVVFLSVYLQGFGIIHLILALLISTILVFIAAYDARHTIIPDSYVYLFVVLSFLWHLPQVTMYTFISAVVLAMPFALLWLISKGKWIGLGDAKLMLGIGALLGLGPGFVALTIASVTGAILSISYIVVSRLCTAHLGTRQKKSRMKLEVPYGPFLIFGFFLVWLLHIDLWYFQIIGL